MLRSASSAAVLLQFLVQHIRIEPDAAFPGDRGRFGIDAHFFELSHIAPQLESADLEQSTQKDASFETVVEADPQLVVLFSLARVLSVHDGFSAHGTIVAFQSQLSAPPVWYSMTRVSKKLRSFLRSIISLIQGNGLVAPGYSVSRPICWERRLAMNLRYYLKIGAFSPSTPRGMVSSA